MRDLPPVEQNAERPEALSQTFLARADVCARSAYLYVAHKGGPTSHRMDGGTCLHEFARRFVELLIETEERSAPPDVAKDLLEAVIQENPELQLPHAELDALRVMAYHLAEGLYVEPDKVVALEKMLELQLDGHRIRGKVDFAAIYPDTREAIIRDYKSSYAIPSQADFDNSFQTKFYALLLAEGKGEDDPVPIGKGLDTFKVEEIYPRYKGLPGREAILTRQQLLDFKRDVQAVVDRAEHGFETGKWPAVRGDHCSRCPAPQECPLPAEILPIAVNGDRLAMAEREHELSEEAAQLRKKLKADVDLNGPLHFGSDLVWEFSTSESERINDRETVKGYIETGGGDPSDYFKKSVSTRFSKSKVKS